MIELLMKKQIPTTQKAKNYKQRTNRMLKRTYLEPVIPTNNSDAKNVLLIIKKFQPLGACCGRKPRFNIYFSDAANSKVFCHLAPANKGLVLLGLIKSPH